MYVVIYYNHVILKTERKHRREKENESMCLEDGECDEGDKWPQVEEQPSDEEG